MLLTDQILRPQGAAIDRSVGTVDQPLTDNIANHASSTAMTDSNGDCCKHRPLTTAMRMMLVAVLFFILLLFVQRHFAAPSRVVSTVMSQLSGPIHSCVFMRSRSAIVSERRVMSSMSRCVGSTMRLRWAAVFDVCPEGYGP